MLRAMGDLSPIAWLMIGAGAALLVAVVRTFNAFVGARNACRDARSGIDVQLTKRHDLVPNLVRVVAGYADHERAVFELVAEARTAAVRALASPTSPAAEAELERALARLDLRVEAYPALKASEQFLHLQRNLTEIEEQIAAARRAFNAHATAMNNLVERFPTRLVARAMGFGTVEYFASRPEERAAPSVAAAGHTP